MDNSFVWVKVGRLLLLLLLLLRLLGPGRWLLLSLLLLHPMLTRKPQRMLGLGLLLLGGRTGAVPRRVGFPKTCLPLLWIYSNSGGYWRRAVEWRRDPIWRRGSWDIVSGVVRLLVGRRIGSSVGGHGRRYNRVRIKGMHDRGQFVPALGFIQRL